MESKELMIQKFYKIVKDMSNEELSEILGYFPGRENSFQDWRDEKYHPIEEWMDAVICSANGMTFEKLQEYEAMKKSFGEREERSCREDKDLDALQRLIRWMRNGVGRSFEIKNFTHDSFKMYCILFCGEHGNIKGAPRSNFADAVESAFNEIQVRFM